MTMLVIHTYILISDPEVVSYKKDNTELIVPDVVVD